jgi:hypothetical protein
MRDLIVMPGPVPAIHLLAARSIEEVGGWDKPGQEPG